MDNICHSLVGGALARTGLDKRTPLATATMMLGANFPDIDVVAVPLGADIGFRRGITHGIPAHVVLPFVLTGIMLAWDRWVRRRRDPSLPAAVPREILLLSALSIATHPFLDWCNSYGMRWLMPVRNEWFYGDSLFIVDVWLWITLFLGFVLSKRLKSTAPARIALALSAGYIATMMTGTMNARRAIASERQAGGGYSRRELMVAPVALIPNERQVVLARGESYLVGRWANGRVEWQDSIPINRNDPAVARAIQDPALADFLHWSRFPFFIVTRGVDGGTVVQVSDARYSDRFGGGWASRTVVVR